MLQYNRKQQQKRCYTRKKVIEASRVSSYGDNHPAMIDIVSVKMVFISLPANNIERKKCDSKKECVKFISFLLMFCYDDVPFQIKFNEKEKEKKLAIIIFNSV